MPSPQEPVLTCDQKQQLILQANTAAQAGDHGRAWSLLRTLPLQAFGELLLDVPEFHRALRAWLPSMVGEDVQRDWTGSAGLPLLLQSTDFVASIEKACQQYLGHGLQGRVLDYGCGWGRLLRLMLRYVDPEQLHGTDPWGVSLALCRQHRCMGQVAACDYVPRTLPFEGEFDLVYAFSVFTHLSENTANAVLQVLHRHLRKDGMLVLTIRPPGYWDVHQGWYKGFSREFLLEQHHKRGYAFMPHHRAPVDGEITYGDASIALDYIAERWTDWRVLGTDHNASDPWQIIVFLQPA